MSTYLDWDGFVEVAQNINTRLKVVNSLPSDADSGSVRMLSSDWWDENNVRYLTGHIYYNNGSSWSDISKQLGANYIASIENSNIASKNYVVDDLMIFQGQLCKVIKDISQGSQINQYGGESRNVELTTISEILALMASMDLRSETLTAGSTSVTFTQIPTTGNYLISFYTSTGVSYNFLNTSVSGQVTVTFDVQSSDVVVYCKIEKV